LQDSGRSALTKRTLRRGGWGGEFRRVGGGEHGVDDGLVLEFLVAELADMLRVDVFLDGAEIADAEVGDVRAFVEIFVAVLALGDKMMACPTSFGEPGTNTFPKTIV
jgi:hypothetical protein